MQHVFQVVRTVDEHKVERRDPAEVIRHRGGRDEERLVGHAEVVGEPPPIRVLRHLALLFDRARCSPRHPSHQVDREDPGILVRPPRQVRRHVPQSRADFQHARRAGMAEQRQHRPRIILAGIAADRPANVRAFEPLREVGPAHRHEGTTEWFVNNNKLICTIDERTLIRSGPEKGAQPSILAA